MGLPAAAGLFWQLMRAVRLMHHAAVFRLVLELPRVWLSSIPALPSSTCSKSALLSHQCRLYV